MEQTSEIVLLGGKACLLRSLILVDMRTLFICLLFQFTCLCVNTVDKERSKESALHLKQKVQSSDGDA